MSKHKNTGIPRATHAGMVQQMFRYQSLAKREPVLFSRMQGNEAEVRKEAREGQSVGLNINKYVVNCAGNTQECNHCPNNSSTQAQRATDPNTHDLGLNSSFVIPMDRGAWWAIANGVAEWDTTEQLSTQHGE